MSSGILPDVRTLATTASPLMVQFVNNGSPPAVAPSGALTPYQNPDGSLSAAGMFWATASIASTAFCAWHGYKRNQSVGWAFLWGVGGAMAPIIAPAIAVAQGAGERAKGM